MFYSQQHHPPLSVLISTQLKIHLAVLSLYTTQQGFYSLVSPWSGMSLGISVPWWGAFKTRRFRHKTPREKERGGTRNAMKWGKWKENMFLSQSDFSGQTLLNIWNFISWPSLTSHIKDRIWTSQQNLNPCWTFPNISPTLFFVSSSFYYNHFSSQLFLVSFQQWTLWDIYNVLFSCFSNIQYVKHLALRSTSGEQNN